MRPQIRLLTCGSVVSGAARSRCRSGDRGARSEPGAHKDWQRGHTRRRVPSCDPDAGSSMRATR